ncbi:c-type cytochrome biogenesis protein CcsB [Actinoplanes sp. ATCC 53533]|uniref:c-type cytochrome biogenesis protein CcsB n=1 Tax=Actinoplanes sp. ATCC 53533 TaxID=1288362 RepID=UPI000F78C357|nr:c-type cytochrome biogenesis protein CcsB [Actinoplanes sp. ATCC 53533]RSM71646.1 c-type cytochrome biogenesis protein CcsB [Actinoplanes sp. ATCC 53533]
MAALSDQLLVLTILAYVAAMVGYAAEHAFGTSDAAAPAIVRESAMAGTAAVGHATRSDDPVPAGQRRPAGARGRGDRWAGRLAVCATLVGVLSQVGCVVTRGVAAGRVPWGNMYEFILVVSLTGVVAWLVLLVRRPRVRPLGLYVTFTAVILLGLAGMRVYTAAGPLVPALNSYWLKIHVSAAAVASGIFLLGFVVAALQLLRSRHDRRLPAVALTTPTLVTTLGRRLPDAAVLERLSFRLHAFGFPIWTFAVLAGAVWAEAAWGRYWGWDPKEVWAFISWVVYAAYLHARATPSIKRTTTAWLAVLGWATMMINLFAVNLVVAGLHSYAGTE